MGYINFFTTIQGVKVELLKVKVQSMDLAPIKQYMELAQANLNELLSALRNAKVAA